MSHKRSLKRSRGSFAEVPGLFSPSTEYMPTKRSKLEEHAEVEESSSVRRSSRAPKPKMFDDEYVDTFRSSFDENEARGKKEKVLVEQERRSSSDSSLNVFESDASVRRSSRVPKPKSFDEDYIDSPKAKTELKANERESVKKTTEELSPVVDFAGAKLQKVHNTKEDKKEKRKRKSYPDEKSETFIDKNTHGDQKVKKSGSKKLNFSIDSLLHGNPLSRTDDDAAARGGDATGESSKVRQSSRTPVPKKTFALIEDPSLMSNQDGCLISEEDSEDVDVEGISSPKTSHRSNKKHQVRLSSPLIDPSTPGCSTSSDIPTPVSLEQDIKKGKSKLHVEEKPSSKKKLKKVKPDSGMLVGSEMLPESLSDVQVLEASFEGSSKKTGKDKIKKTSRKASTVAMRSEKKHSDNKEDTKCTSFEVGEKVQAKKKSKKKVSQQGELQGTVDANVVQSPPASEKVHSKHSSSEHGKKPHSKHTKTKHDKAHSEIKDQDQHIILKLHLPHAEGSAHTHSHKKHKHKHHSTPENKTEGSSGDAKSKKRKLSLESASPTTKEQTPKKKVSIKFKGLSSNKPGVEVEVGHSKLPLPLSGVEKVVKEPETKKKKAKKKIDNVEATPIIPSDEQEHLKMVIKKKKKEVKVIESENTADKTQIKESKSKPKEPKAVNKVEGNEAKPKASPKKKSKASDTPSKSPKVKEKRKVITGYLLFCKKERSIIAETNPGLEFVEISKKVGIAWNNLTDNEKQKWRDKANNMKARLGVDKKEEKKPEPARGGPDSVDMAAHLKLLGESLSLIGVSLMAQRETEVHGSLSVLLDSILCAICPLTFLTSYIPGIPGITKDKQVQILDDLAYTMPGLG